MTLRVQRFILRRQGSVGTAPVLVSQILLRTEIFRQSRTGKSKTNVRTKQNLRSQCGFLKRFRIVNGVCTKALGPEAKVITPEEPKTQDPVSNTNDESFVLGF